jgi:hypothetical protein
MLEITYYTAKNIVKIYKRENRIDKKKMKKNEGNQKKIGNLQIAEEQGVAAMPSMPLTSPHQTDDERAIVCPIPRLWTCTQNLGGLPDPLNWGMLLSKYCR